MKFAITMSSTKGLSYFFVKNIVLCGFVWSDPSIISKPLDAPETLLNPVPPHSIGQLLPGTRASVRIEPFLPLFSLVRPNRRRIRESGKTNH